MFRPAGLAVLFLVGCVDRSTVIAPVQVDVRNVRAAPIVAGAKNAPRRVGDAVEVEWKGEWWPAHVLEVRGDGYLIRYDGYSKDWDETVAEDRVRARRVEREPEPDPPEPDLDEQD